LKRSTKPQHSPDGSGILFLLWTNFLWITNRSEQKKIQRTAGWTSESKGNRFAPKY